MTTLRPARSTEQVLAVANARHGPAGHWHSRAREDEPDHDHLRRPDDAVAFLADHGVDTPATVPRPAVMEALRMLAAEVRALAAGSDGPWPSAALVRSYRRAAYRVEPDGRLTSVAPDPWHRLVDELLAAAVALGEHREQLRTCDNLRCRFVFLDRSRNRSRRWCDMAACGNRAKLRRYRGRGRGRGRDQPSGRMSGLRTSQAMTTSASRPTSSSSGRRSGR